MLTKKQTKSIDKMVKEYRNGILKVIKMPEHLADRYAERYRQRIIQGLQRQNYAK